MSAETTDARALAAMLRSRYRPYIGGIKLMSLTHHDAERIAAELERLADLEAAMGNLCSRQPTCGGAI